MEELDEILGFIRDANAALCAFSDFYKIERYPTKTEVRLLDELDEEVVVVLDDGIRRRIGYDRPYCPQFILKGALCKGECTLNCACGDLIAKYGSMIEEDYAKGLVKGFETMMYGCDEAKRLYIVRSIIERSSYMLYKREVSYSAEARSIVVNEEFIYNDDGDKEIRISESNDTLGVFMAMPVIAWLLEEAEYFFLCFGNICKKWGIDLRHEVSGIVSSDIEEMNFYLLGICGSGEAFDDAALYDKKQQKGSATVKMKCEVLVSLLKALNNDVPPTNVELSKFVSWLCGGSPEYVRQYGFSGVLKDSEMEIVKSKLNSVGINYDNGKINTSSSKKVR